MFGLGVPMQQGLGGLLGGLLGSTPEGLGGGLSGLQTGAQGLFAALVGGEGSPQIPDTNALVAMLNRLNGMEGVALPDALFNPAAGDVVLGEGAVQVSFQAVMIEIRQTVTMFQQAGIELTGLGKGQDLAAAFVQMGMSPAEAVVKATQIETMLELVRQQLGLPREDGETAGGLLAMLAASSTNLTPMVQSASITQTQVDIAHVQVAASITTMRKAGVAAFAATPAASTLQLARGMLQELDNLPSALTAPQAEVAQQNEQAVVASALAQEGEPEVLGLTLANVVKDTLKGRLHNTEAAENEDAGVGAPSPSDMLATTTKPAPILPEQRLPSTVSAIAPAQVIKAPEGIEVAVMTDTPEGLATLSRKVPASQLREMEPMPLNTVSAATTPATPSADLLGVGGKISELAGEKSSLFADKLAHATRADVTQQAVVQIRELAGQGGGTIRMILSPPELGEIRIELVIKAGTVEGRISATDNAVVELLARDVHSLRQGLADAGLKLGDQGLSLMLGGGNPESQQQFGQQGNQNPQGQNQQTATWLDDGEKTSEADALTGWVSPDQLVDIRV